jgi:hypothetical protein
MKRAMNPNTFKAPWGKTLCRMSAFSLVVVAIALVPAFLVKRPEWLRLAILLPLLLLPGTALVIIRTYTIEPNVLAIQRLLWTTRLPLSGLQSAEAMPNAMRSNLRLFGNGGMFSITGLYRNRALGNYRTFVTDLTKTVVLRFPKRTIVVSPENPAQFVADISRFAFRIS